MDRRKSIKALVVGTVSAGVLVEACKTDDKKKPADKLRSPVLMKATTDRMPEEIEYSKATTG